MALPLMSLGEVANTRCIALTIHTGLPYLIIIPETLDFMVQLLIGYLETTTTTIPLQQTITYIQIIHLPVMFKPLGEGIKSRMSRSNPRSTCHAKIIVGEQFETGKTC